MRAEHPLLGGLLLRFSSDPQTTAAGEVGAIGERLGARLDVLSAPTGRVLHDRRIPGTRANLDHLLVCQRGVVVIDAKKYQGRPRLRVHGGLLRPRVESLVVGGRDRTKLVDAMLTKCASSALPSPL